MSERDYEAEYKALRKAVFDWIKADFYCHSYPPNECLKSMKGLEKAEAALRDAATGESSVLYAALIAKDPRAEELALELRSKYPPPETYRAEEMMQSLKRGKKP